METNNGQCYSYAKITYIEELACFCATDSEGHMFSQLADEKYDIEVIGNIYENPELLED